MANDYHEKDYDDEVYEDGYYEEHYEEEELEDESELLEEEEEVAEEAGRIVDEEAEEEPEVEGVEELGWDEEDQKKMTVSYACEECDYRWDDVVIKKKGVIEEEEPDIICPMCGSMNVTLI
jgi:DNA-directed RNA polymerase subunit M/transcription elongation factor TFIIS